MTVTRTPTQQFGVRAFAVLTDDYIFVCDDPSAETGGTYAVAIAEYVATKANAFNRQAGNYTATLADLYTVTILSTDASVSTVTLPGYGSGSGEVLWPDGATLKGIQEGAGQVTLAVSGGSTTLKSLGSNVAVSGQYGVWSAMYDATDDAWILFGSLGT